MYKRANLHILNRFQKLKAAEESSSMSGKGSGHIFYIDIHVKYKKIYSVC